MVCSFSYCYHTKSAGDQHRIGFEPRTAEEHRRLGEEWRQIPLEERDEWFKTHGTRYTELSRLPYFDPIRCTVVDPMHNLLLGMAIYSPYIPNPKQLFTQTYM